MRFRLFALALSASLCLFGASACRADQTGSFHRTFTVNGPVSLQISTGAGDVHVTGAPGSTVTVDGTIHQSWSLLGGNDPHAIRDIENNPPVEQTGNTISIRGLHHGWNDHVWISYVITTPPNTRLDAHSGSGDINVAGLSGSAELGAGSGDLQVANLGGNLRAETGSGNISFDHIHGEARLSAGSGTIEGSDVGGHFSADTGSGDVRVQRLQQGAEVHTSSGDQELRGVSGDLSAHASSGTIRTDGQLDGAHRWNLSASSGDITISLPAQTAANVRLETSSGSMEVHHSSRSLGQLGRHVWQGVMGSASSTAADLTIRTSSGDIRVN